MGEPDRPSAGGRGRRPRCRCEIPGREGGAGGVGAATGWGSPAEVKRKLLADPDLSALDVSVNTTNGRVTLSGTVSAADQIGKSMLLALETDGVREVVSTLQVKSTEPPAKSG